MDGGELVNAWLSFSLTPVQSFLQAARTVRDLKVGSKLLSYLAGQAFDAACAAGGRALYPAHSGDWHNLPNRFVVCYETLAQAQSAAEGVHKAFDKAWYTLADEVKKLLDQQKWPAPWDEDWDKQVQTFWDARVIVVDTAAWSDDDYRALFNCASGAPLPNPLTRGWKVTTTALAAAKAVRKIPPDQGIGRPKCTMMGDLEQMGPGGPVGTQRGFWRDVTGTSHHGIRIGERDRLCAIALIKRFAPACDSTPLRELRCPISDTATIATEQWRKEVQEGLPDELAAFDSAAGELAKCLGDSADTSGRYLLDDNLRYNQATWSRLNEGLSPEKRHPDPRTWEQSELAGLLKKTVGARDALKRACREKGLSAPPRYLAIVELDGDHMGRLLGGDGEDVTEEHFQHLSSRLRAYGDSVPGMVTEHYGETIYAGGDELLALAPRIEAIPLARELRNNFPDNLAEKVTRRGSTASMGITIFHYRHDLRDALHHTHQAIDRAKKYGRDCCGIAVLKRSGSELHVVASWNVLDAMKALAESFASGVTDRWLSQLAQMAPGVHPNASKGAVEALIRRVVKRGEGTPQGVIDQVMTLWNETWAFLNDPNRPGPEQDDEQFGNPVFNAFLNHVGIASFLVRGGE
ncbi:MAG TPA: type III-B CRISPR-associated protein Cas10/Cmr2 [Armatimonadota bacterium]|nr:type III-B CRISPR-associated protein Cas10/Cmr2 [Armatimonadota bacterium]